MNYTVTICVHCKNQANYSKRDRLSYGWYCPNHADKSTHAENFYGYLKDEDVDRIETAPVEPDDTAYPIGCKSKPKLTDTVQVLMREDMARKFEQFLLTNRGLELAGPLLFSEDDLPTYIIGIQH